MKKILLPLLAILTIFTSCDDDLDDNVRPATALELSDFVYRGLNFWSLYKEDVPDLANDRFANDAEKESFLSQFDSPEEAFEALTSSQDRFSILRDDYIVLENALNGVRVTSGINIAINAMPNDPTTGYGLVRYVVKNSPAEDAGIERGMIFTLVDGQQLKSSDGGLINEDTSFARFFAENSYTISLASYDGVTFNLTGDEIVLNKEQISINPVHIARTLDIEGEKIGYLHYTGFTRDFDPQLNAAFGQFQADGVTDLVLDLRYNGGGSIETANDLSSMITGQFNNEIFITQTYNEDRNPDNQIDRKFNTQIGNEDAINSLGLSRVFVLTSGSTASASELILSGLDPYIEVIQIGTNTRGKFEGSFLLYDAPAPNFARSQANINHRYVMLPLVLRSVNANGLTDYFDGFTPDIEIAETFENLGQLGFEGEPLLDIAIEEILSTRSIRNVNTTPDKMYFESDQDHPLYQRMMVEN